MKDNMKAGLIIIMFVILGVALGRCSVSDPTPEQCLSICVEEFERMAA